MNEVKIDDIVMMKKPHACGYNYWKIIRYGADIKLKCLHCNRVIMLERPKFTKKFKKKLESKEGNNGK